MPENNCVFCGSDRASTPEFPSLFSQIGLGYTHTVCYLRHRASLGAIQKESMLIAQSKGFNQEDRTIGDALALIHSEVSEALEEFRKGNLDRGVYYRQDQGDGKKPLGWGVELADILIRVAHLAEETGVDLVNVVWLKMEYNKTREMKHGKVI